MAEKNKAIREIWNQFEDFMHVFLATMDGEQPHVRPVTLINFDNKLWITTDTSSQKVKQIQRNPKIEFSFTFKKHNMDCCMRLTGQAKIIEDKQTKTKLAKHCNFFSEHWENTDDPNYTLIEITPTEATTVTPQNTTHTKL